VVIVSLRFEIVHIPIELDHDPFTGTKEVYDEAVQHMLSPKLQAEDAAVAQQRPRVPFSWSGAVAKLAGARKSLGGSESTKGIHRLSLPDDRPTYASESRDMAPKKNSPFVPPLRNGEGVRG
jgi:hypothetical protein